MWKRRWCPPPKTSRTLHNLGTKERQRPKRVVKVSTSRVINQSHNLTSERLKDAFSRIMTTFGPPVTKTITQHTTAVAVGQIDCYPLSRYGANARLAYAYYPITASARRVYERLINDDEVRSENRKCPRVASSGDSHGDLDKQGGGENVLLYG